MKIRNCVFLVFVYAWALQHLGELRCYKLLQSFLGRVINEVSQLHSSEYASVSTKDFISRLNNTNLVDYINRIVIYE